MVGIYKYSDDFGSISLIKWLYVNETETATTKNVAFANGLSIPRTYPVVFLSNDEHLRVCDDAIITVY